MSRTEAFFLPLVLCFFFLLLVPYEPFSSVQLVYFLHPFRQAHPDLFGRDWFVTQTPLIHPFFGSLIASFERWGHLAEFLFFLHVLRFFLLSLGIFRLVRFFSDDRRVPFLTGVFLLFYFSEGLGQSHLYSGVMQAIDLGMLAFLFSLAFLLQERMLAAWVLLGVSGLFHVRPAMEGFLLFWIFWVFQRKSASPSRMAAGTLLFFLISSPNLGPLIGPFFMEKNPVSPDIFKVFFNFRAPHHYRPSTFELSHCFRVFFPLFFILKNGFEARTNGRIQSAKLFTAINLAFCFAAVISIEWIYLPAVARLFLFGLSPFLVLLGLIFLSLTLIRELDSKYLTNTLMAGAALFLLFLEKDSRLFIPLSIFLVGVWLMNPTAKKIGLASWCVLATGLFLATGRGIELALNAAVAGILICLLKSSWRRAAFEISLGIFVLGIPALAIHSFFPGRVRLQSVSMTSRPPALQQNPSLAEVLDWIRSHTPKEALFLTPPYQEGIRFFAQRAIVVDFQAHPFGAAGLKEWKERLETATGTSGLEDWKPFTDSSAPQLDWLRRGYLNLKPEAIEKIQNIYGVDYFVTEADFPAKQALLKRNHSLIFENTGYLLFQLKERRAK